MNETVALLTYVLLFSALRQSAEDDSAKDDVALVSILEHVLEQGGHIVSIPHVLQNKHLIEEATKTRNDHL